ncbi:MAG TPA: periplasmic heavy metal sensor [Thermoanaerobaculia bacterium]|nr:periplasmic heavy metal sensor [Thermoanaerobaculia bacterium]
MKRIVALTILLFLPSLLSAAEGLPAGKWWKRPEIIQRLSLTEEQQEKLDATFRSNANGLIDLRADVEKKAVDLRSQLDQIQLNRQEVQKAALRLSESRSRLFERELMLLVDMRAALTNEQWSKFRTVLGHSERRARTQRPRFEDRRRRP